MSEPRDAAALGAILCVVLKLRRSEGRLLAELMVRDCCSREQLRTAVSQDNREITLGSITPFICLLRKRLKPHGIEIATTFKLGYFLDRKARARIYKLLTAHDAGVASTTPAPRPARSQPQASETCVP
jgi:hypothetical protein